MLALTACAARVPVTTSVPFSDTFERADLGPNWKFGGGEWNISAGALHSSGAENAPLWLQAALPRDVTIEFDAWSNSPAVDIKCELFGDGRNHQSGYIVILAGWNNSTSIIARLREHGSERTPEQTSRLIADVKADACALKKANKELQERISRRVHLQPASTTTF